MTRVDRREYLMADYLVSRTVAEKAEMKVGAKVAAWDLKMVV